MDNSEIIKTIVALEKNDWEYVGSFDSEGGAYKFIEIERSPLFKDFKVESFNNQHHVFKQMSI